MAHINSFLPKRVELGAVRRVRYSTDTVVTDGGYEVRNARWSTPLKTFEISFPTAKRDNPDYLAVLDLYEDSKGGLDSFFFHDWTDPSGSTIVRVRFDSELSITTPDPRYDHIDTLTLVEVRE